MKALIEGFLRFQSVAFPQRSDLFKNLATTQHPGTLFITCSDSCIFWSNVNTHSGRT